MSLLFVYRGEHLIFRKEKELNDFVNRENIMVDCDDEFLVYKFSDVFRIKKSKIELEKLEEGELYFEDEL